MKDKGRAMTKAEAANATIQNARKALDNVKLPFQIVIPSARRKGRHKFARQPYFLLSSYPVLREFQLLTMNYVDSS